MAVASSKGSAIIARGTLAPMKRLLPLIAIALLAACGGKPEPATPVVSKNPISVRGWIDDAEGPPTEVKTQETEAARKAQLFQAINVWVDGAPYVSGGVAENGSFILLDVPEGNVTISFAAPGIPQAKVVLQNVPGNADVLLPGVVLKKSGVAQVEDPKAIKVRMAANIAAPKPAGKTITINGQPAPVIDTPIAKMVDRRDFPNPPGYVSPIATVR
jgi:hypothetical protein